ncbi:MAG: 3-deoxy-7-phosphoheptulonate synthase [Planctomycetaceae bacterium]|nr:3-deoxy-7-phosphoheptulonate synthase [Planctomycetaceae bacterium]
MIINIHLDAPPETLGQVADSLAQANIRARQTQFGGRTVIVTESNLDEKTCTTLLKMQAVESIVEILDPYPLCSLQTRPQRTTIRIRDFAVGPNDFSIIAGPCTVESEKQVLTTAEQVKAAGAKALRGGAFKPRTSPYAFQGLKLEGLKILQKVSRETGLVTVTEAMSSEEVKMVSEYADVVQIGTRNAQNYRLLETCGEARVPILLKRGFSNSLDEFLMAAEYILAGGNEQVILCERGIRTFETYVRYTLPAGAVPALKLTSHLPVIVDPSHAAGRADLVASLSYASVASGADGLLVEVHPDPKHALCDGRQSLTPDEFSKMVRICEGIRKAVGC